MCKITKTIEYFMYSEFDIFFTSYSVKENCVQCSNMRLLLRHTTMFEKNTLLKGIQNFGIGNPREINFGKCILKQIIVAP